MNSTEVYNKDGFYAKADLFDTQPQTAANYGIFFQVIRPCEFMEVREIHGTAGTDAGAVTLQVEKLTGTTAKGSGLNILVTAYDLKGTINTSSSKTGVALQNRQLAAGDRLAIKSSGTLTALKDLQVTIYLKPLGKGDYR